MNTLKIVSMRYKNFKGLKDYTLEPNSKSLSVFGDNATGKTTTFDGFLWLFFGKDSMGRADSQIKPVDADNNEIHNLDTEVEAHLEYNGTSLVLLRRFSEKYTKTRGSATKDFSGHTTVYFIDEVPAKKKDFNAKILEILDMNVFKLVTNPMEFNSLHWAEQRTILFGMCGGVADGSVCDFLFPRVEDKDRLIAIVNILNSCGIDDQKKKNQSKKRDINKELEQIPARIDELKNSIKDSTKPGQTEMDSLQSAMDEQAENLRATKNNEDLSAKNIELNEIKGKIIAAKNDAGSQTATLKKPIHADIDRLNDELRTLNLQGKDLKDSISTDTARNQTTEEAMDQLRKRFVSERDAEKEVTTTCPTCSQDLPEEKVQETIEKYKTEKAKTLEGIQAEGKALKKTFADREKSITDSQTKAEAISKEALILSSKIVDQNNKIEALVGSPVDTKALEKEKGILETKIGAIKNGSATREKDIQGKITDIQEKIDTWKEQEASFNAAEKSRVRIEELETQEKTLAAAFEKLEAELFLIEQFIVKKVEMLEGQINSKFKMATFKLFKEQINGGIEECCETLYNGVPFSHGLNNAARINVGLDIISTLSEYYGFKAPIFVDNAEGVNELTKMDTQVISLVVSDDKELITRSKDDVK